MNDFRIEVFLSVARNLSFTKASKELFISQPAISKHINELENSYRVRLFERTNNKVILTSEGKIFYKFAQEIHSKYRELEYEINRINKIGKGKLSIGASTTIAQYILPSIISKYKNKFPDIELTLVTGNSEYIESLITNNKVDLGIVEGAKHKKEFKYTPFTKDELVLVVSPEYFKEDEISMNELLKLPLILREEGSGTLEVIKNALKKRNIKLNELNVIMRLGSSEAIKRFVMAGNSFAIISIAAVVDELKRNELSVVEIDDIMLNREFSFITNIGSQDKLVEQLIIFFSKHYNNKL